MIKIPTVPVDEAIKLTTNWRSFYADIYNDSTKNLRKIDPNGKDVFRGFRIPMEDVEQLLAVSKEFNEQNQEKINSLRAYLVKDTEDVTKLSDIHIILVPVIDGKNGELFKSGLPVLHGRDLLEVKNAESDVNESVIYDFTSPCPTECDPESDLYSSPVQDEEIIIEWAVSFTAR